jgi:hypothetical protein
MAKIDWNTVIIPVIQNIVIPEIVAFIKWYRDKTGGNPTDEQVKEALHLSVVTGLSMWEAWDNEHPEKSE